jgi:DNA-binding transcriptional ArsR family regulator
MPKIRQRPDIRVSIAKLLRELQDGPALYDELVQASGLAESTVRLWLMAFRNEGVARIKAFDLDAANKPMKLVIELNPDRHPDAKRPRKKSQAEKDRHRRERKRLRRLGQALTTQTEVTNESPTALLALED